MLYRILFALALLLGVVPMALAKEFTYHADYVLGTSYDLAVDAADQTAADQFNAQAMAEITRLSAIISTYDPKSEISTLPLNTAKATSPELVELLGLYDKWEKQTDGALCGRLGEVIALWKAAGKKGQLPDAEALQQAVGRAAEPAWKINAATGMITRISDVKLNVDAIGKAYIIDKALAAARQGVPAAKRAMLNIGGEIACAGAWQVEVGDPETSAENAPVMMRLKLVNQAISVSGSASRFVTIDGKRYSHLIDPKTGQTANLRAAAAVVAKDCSTANGLSTALCILPAERGQAIVEQTPGVSALIIDGTGVKRTTAGWNALQVVTEKEKPAEANPNWPAGYAVQIKLKLPEQPKPYRRPYVVFWIADDMGTPIRTLALWGTHSKYWNALKVWRPQAKESQQELVRLAKATRGPGEYEIVWDGKDEQGNFVKAGSYMVACEVVREKGGHEKISVALRCTTSPNKASKSGISEVGELAAEFGGKQP